MTVQAQVVLSLRELVAREYHFCATPSCPVVYFAPNGQAIQQHQLRERVFPKDAADEVLICFCFRYSLGQLRQARRAECAVILADIVAGIQQGQCACTLRNPQGACCLGNVRRIMEISRT